jgi:Beta-glucosidase/6-phospho-beta-glucosidase/beta-galactosidase
MVCLSAFLGGLYSQTRSDQIYVDDNGVMRWKADKTEVQGFGVNYTLPFAHEYRMALRTGIAPEEAIKQDIYHMARLDLDLYRVHVWDTEISDSIGNLVNNEHLRLFDFTVSEMKKRGMRFIITPIAYWGNGWPENDEPTPGFSRKYGKAACLTNPAAIEAQARYLNQFLSHVNSYTGVAYKDEANVIGFEICNEPHHGEAADKVTAFINKMVASMRKTGCSKPIFYNMSHSIHLADAYLNANVQGGTFQWYPTNLVANHQINGNFLPHVETYPIPFANNPKFKKMAKIVYEFDPADAGGNIMYTAMARTFRETGMQLATQFAYDAMCWAPYNTNYGTHFMNLAYAPHKAISLKIASAIFHNVKLYQKHTDNTRFDGFHISYSQDLAEWVTSEKFFYSNNTASQPETPDKLKEIAGCGSSPVVKYNGTGAYFLDKLADGVWRLEVMPDAYWVADPYSPVNPAVQKAAVQHAQELMSIALPNLGNEFEASPVNNGNSFVPKVSNGQFIVIPGVFLLKRKNISTEIKPDLVYKNIKINEFVAPASNLAQTTLWNHTSSEAIAGRPLQLSFEAASPSPIAKIEVVLSIEDKWQTLTANNTGSNAYSVEVPQNMTINGMLNYRIMVIDNRDTTTFPGGKKGNPWSWVNRDNNTYTLRLIPEASPLILWNAETDWDNSYKTWNRNVNLKTADNGEPTLAIQMAQLPAPNPTDVNDKNYAFKYFFANKIKGQYEQLRQKKMIAIKAANALATAQPVEIGLIDKNGTVMAGTFAIAPEENVFRISLDNLKKVPFLIIPRPFPDFLPYTVQPDNKPFDWSAVETLQVVVKPGAQENVNLNIEKIWME